MLSADHLNIGGPPVPANCIRKFGSALGEEVVYRFLYVCVHARILVQEDHLYTVSDKHHMMVICFLNETSHTIVYHNIAYLLKL